jgi:hypothetical protein
VAIKKRKTRETGNIGQDEEKQNKKLNTVCVGHHHTQTNTNNVNKTKTLLQTVISSDFRKLIPTYKIDMMIFYQFERKELVN